MKAVQTFFNFTFLPLFYMSNTVKRGQDIVLSFVAFLVLI